MCARSLLVSLILVTNLWGNGVLGESSGMAIIKNWISDWKECSLGESPTVCLEERTIRNLRGINIMLKHELRLDQDANGSRRISKELNLGNDEEIQSLESDNNRVMKEIHEKESNSRGLIDEIGDLFIYLTTKIYRPFVGGLIDSTENEEVNGGKQAIEGRGKKKELKKQNKKLKLILVLMLIKNKIKMFVQKLQFLVQLKFLGVATINMLANVIRLWIELKKKHKPNKVIYYESAHHQHHYDNEHIDHDYGRPSHVSHFSHHEDEDYGGPWPWSRSYSAKPNPQNFKTLSPQQQRPNSPYKVIYTHERSFR